MAVIIIHEFGHFIVAKWCGVKVNEFAVGFGPKLFSFKKGETEYRFNLIPLGGYCAMEGENEASGDTRAFCNKKPWQRLLIVAAGAVFNLILGVILVAVTLIPSDRFATTKIAEFSENAVSKQYGLTENDEIISVNGRRVFTTYDMSYTFTGIDDGKVDLVVLRNGERVELPDVKFQTEKIEGINYLSVDFWVYGQKKTISSFISQTFKMTVSYVRVVWFSLIDLIAGKFGLNAISGPVGITAVVGNATKQNIGNLWPILALITINLGIFNLLPIPALDGGRIFTIIIEMIFRKRVNEKVENVINTVGFVILFLFMLVVMASDIFKLITG